MPDKDETLIPGRAIQVVAPTPDHTFTLEEEELSHLLLKEDIRDRAVVVVSVAGAFRKGKSFLLDFFLRYLHQKYDLGLEDAGWMGSEEAPLRGFGWRGGSERDTTGLLLWSQPFKATLPDGKKVVILLMDTQGAFDSESTVRDCATVFALSTMLSSVQIYNLSQNIDEVNLQHLQLFTNYGRLVLETFEASGSPFQRLQFLVRDWNYPYEYPYGQEGGKQLLHKRLDMQGQHEELQTPRKYITSCFEKLDCFLMPHPGMRVATDKNFNGSLKDISEEFKSSLSELVPSLLSPEHLVVKRISGEEVKAKDLLHYFKAYLNTFSGDELPEPMTVLKATAEANNLSAAAEAQDVYKLLMEEVCGGTKPYVPPQVLDEEHRRAKDKALHAFHSKKKMGGKELADEYSEKLVKELEELYEQLRAHNEGKNLLRMLGTPAVFACLAILALVVSALGSGLGVQTVSALGQTGAVVALLALALWAYTRATGNMREYSEKLDDFADMARNYMIQTAFGAGSRSPTAGMMPAAQHAAREDKKRS